MPTRERIIECGGATLCTEARGDASDPPILLVMGMGASLLWWEDGFCRRLADEGRFVIRYDHRDTGRSRTYEPGDPEYTASDLVTDAVRVLDGYDVAAAHVVGMSMGGGLAQLLALDYPDRVLSLSLISTSPAVAGERDLPPSEESLGRFLSTAHVDWADAGSLVDYLVDHWRVLWGPERTFDEAHIRDLAWRDVERAHDPAAAQNHGLLRDDARERGPLRSITAPTLVIHGTADPMFPLAHGKALATEIPNARLATLEKAGHGIDPVDWQAVTGAILEHTEPARDCHGLR
jgi:pimeloyl-ACP methyl ester carboxylesterase